MSEKEINDLIQTGELAKQDIDDELMEAAEAHAEAQVANLEEEKKKRKKTLIKLGAMLTLTVLILVFTTIAWFSMNREVSAGSMAIRTATMPFEIAVKGSTVRNDTEFIKADNTYTYGDDEIISGYYLTDSSENQIKIRYTPSAVDETDFGPGSSGIIEFYVVPKQDGDLTVRINLDVIGFRELGETNTTIKRVSELTVANSGLEQSVIDQYKSAENYLKGHIMFFEEEGDTDENTLEDQRYYYEKPITTRTLDKTFINARKNVPQKVTVYWMWTNTLGQIALRNNTTGYRSDYPIVKDVANGTSDISNTDKGKVIQYLKDNKNLVFTNYSEITDAIIDDANNASDKTSFKKLSDGYNDADFLIGSSLSYFIVDINVGMPN
ncbi:hypothetical protein SAMN02910317_02070 [Ruminococcaceae bacterium FB2012]|nr:hypothetical protein SAMN02910317_02070 [Ruminococcaceae bacterium FB2012]